MPCISRRSRKIATSFAIHVKNSSRNTNTNEAVQIQHTGNRLFGPKQEQMSSLLNVLTSCSWVSLPADNNENCIPKNSVRMRVLPARIQKQPLHEEAVFLSPACRHHDQHYQRHQLDYTRNGAIQSISTGLRNIQMWNSKLSNMSSGSICRRRTMHIDHRKLSINKGTPKVQTIGASVIKEFEKASTKFNHEKRPNSRVKEVSENLSETQKILLTKKQGPLRDWGIFHYGQVTRLREGQARKEVRAKVVTGMRIMRVAHISHAERIVEGDSNKQQAQAT
ncbi:hypothetical protein BJ508DRAFT_306766 [Ascobolus immersus RN42]|uniref:Uncharacterized protein n=1 Tax=Ascobolus immersus RN42 TaxID=1160509 RepID=A0A3N4I590_ASCIM|nr:hypothetical protein BJ508DRAFT_306766 [Ascobolus immersus RN42]